MLEKNSRWVENENIIQKNNDETLKEGGKWNITKEIKKILNKKAKERYREKKRKELYDKKIQDFVWGT